MKRGARWTAGVGFALLAVCVIAAGCGRKEAGVSGRPPGPKPRSGPRPTLPGPLRIGYGWIENGERIRVDARYLGNLSHGAPLLVVTAGAVVHRARWDRRATGEDDLRGFTPVGPNAAPGFAEPAETLPQHVLRQYAVILIAGDSTATSPPPAILPETVLGPDDVRQLLPRLFPDVDPARLKGSLVSLPLALYGWWALREGDGDPAKVTLVEIAANARGDPRFRHEEGPYGPQEPKCADVEPPMWKDCCVPYFPERLLAADVDDDSVTEVVQFDQCLETAQFWVVRPSRDLQRLCSATVYTAIE